jgi:hypothetical protein
LTCYDRLASVTRSKEVVTQSLGRGTTLLGEISSTKPEVPRRFWLVRREDVSGVSGVGKVAQGVEWESGEVALHWSGSRSRPGVTSTATYKSADELLAVHGHEGSTVIEWIDSERESERVA